MITPHQYLVFKVVNAKICAVNEAGDRLRKAQSELVLTFSKLQRHSKRWVPCNILIRKYADKLQECLNEFLVRQEFFYNLYEETYREIGACHGQPITPNELLDSLANEQNNTYHQVYPTD